MKSTPDDHFTTSPDCPVTSSGSGHVASAGGCPTVGDRIISAAGVQKGAIVVSTPDDHLAAGPDRVMGVPGSGHIGSAGGGPTVGAWVVPPAGVQIVTGTIENVSAPDDDFAANPYCSVSDSRGGRGGVTHGCPTVGVGIVSPAGVQIVLGIIEKGSAPDDHFAASPHCRLRVSPGGRAGGAGGRPTVGVGIVSPAGVQIVLGTIEKESAPDDHVATGPHCRVNLSGGGCVDGAGRCPTVGAGIISPAGPQPGAASAESAPDDHFTAGPDCRVIFSAGGGVGGARWGPCVIGTRNRRTGYHRERVVCGQCCHFHRRYRFGFSQP